jgi:pyruvate dehydrogenase E1 component beta subunit/2-oxoisovalerate dehydrogenase E1 component beta subunit
VIVTPATVEDAYWMLLESIGLDDPVIFCEHKFLYYHLKAEALPSEALPIGKARIAREGRDLTVVEPTAMQVVNVITLDPINKRARRR